MQIVSDYVWEKLHMGHWKDVPLVWRQMHGATKLMSALAALREGRVSQALQEVDKGILMGAPILDGLLQKVASLLTDAITACGDSGSAVSVAVDQDEVVLAVPSMRKSTVGAVEVEGSVGAATQLPTQAPAGDRLRPLRRPIRFRNYQSVCEAVQGEGGTSNDVLEKEPSSCADEVSTAVSVKDRLYQTARKVRKGARIETNEAKTFSETSNAPMPVVEDNTVPTEGSRDQPCAPAEPVPVMECPSLEMFYRHCMQGGRPAVLLGCINHWPAYEGEREWRYRKPSAGTTFYSHARSAVKALCMCMLNIVPLRPALHELHTYLCNVYTVPMCVATAYSSSSRSTDLELSQWSLGQGTQMTPGHSGS